MIKSARIESIDLLRGIVMIVMALDHVRDYFHADAFLYDPTDLSKTSVALFFTRWITHFCAPVFIFLAGTSAFLIGLRKSKQELSVFLLKRGIWLIILELTIVNFAWFFNVQFSLITLFVIWALGIGMIVLAAFIHLPFKAILAIGALMVVGHNVFDNFKVDGNGPAAILWSMVHQFQGFSLSESYFLFIGYPIIPWIGVMMLGYCFGTFYQTTYSQTDRKKILLYLGFSLIALFVLIRLINGYGDPNPWSTQPNPVFTVLSFLNVTKYPPSLLYVLVTLGPAILFLAISENYYGSVSQKIKILGRVPMFYYLLHLYLIHLLALTAALLTGYEASDMVFNTWVTNSPNLVGYGFSLWVVYVVWISVVLILYPLCKWYDTYKATQRSKWWLSYL
ncbi:MAG TPA: heparan-alpha-glucosaminide N-acetyltransferase domain-containing protein [Chryseolinea sp.]|nr:heparan-alpha-glucosaminide N-acetyltransferase domain-containing protein [Chryseolinea sp.]